jgi:NADH dehydrogenase FAD-containing subunit
LINILNYRNSRVYALGDCAFITDPSTGNPYPTTAQHAIRQSKIVAKNIIAEVDGRVDGKTVFGYKTKGLMAKPNINLVSFYIYTLFHTNVVSLERASLIGCLVAYTSKV